MLTPKKRAGEWVPTFLQALSNSGNVRAACLAAGISKQEAYKRRERQPDFGVRWDEAMKSAIEILEAEARRRALSSSDTLLIFLLKAHKPDMYRETVRVEVFRREAEALAERYGLDVDEIIREAEAIARGA